MPVSQCRTFCLQHLQHASSICSKVPRVAVWGPLPYQGLSIHHLWTTEGVEHILAMLRHATCPTLTGQLIWTATEEMQLETGIISTSFLCYSHEAYGPLATHSWTAQTWRFLLELKVRRRILSTSLSLLAMKIPFSWNVFFAYGYRGRTDAFEHLLHTSTCMAPL